MFANPVFKNSGIYANELLDYVLEISIKTIFLSISVRTFSTSFHVQDVVPVTLIGTHIFISICNNPRHVGV